MSGAQPAPEPLADAVLALLNGEDAHAVLYGVTGTHPGDYGGVTKDEALECAGNLLVALRAVVAAAQADQQPEGDQAQGLRQGGGSQ